LFCFVAGSLCFFVARDGNRGRILVGDILMSPQEMNQLRQMARKIHEAEIVLGILSFGQRADLLLDNFEILADCDHAYYVLAALEDFQLV
jgi:hypothetical protein